MTHSLKLDSANSSLLAAAGVFCRLQFLAGWTAASRHQLH